MSLKEQMIKNILLMVLLITISGCGVWNNFTTYFNLYYNTEHLFNEAEKDILTQRSDLFSRIVPPLNTSTAQKLQSVIEKCSNILQFKGDSKYVDDALLMLGKTFYYQQNFLKSERELNELLATQKNSDLRLEAQLWLGKCQIKLEDVATGLKTLESVRKTAVENDEGDILESVLIEELKYKVATDDYDGAIQASQDFLKISNDNTISAKIAFELGKLYELVNDEESAAKAYGEVLNYSPSYDMELNSKIAYGVALRNAGHRNEAVALFDDMSSQDKYKDAFDQINYQKGVTLDSLGNFSEALNVLIQVDTAYKNTRYAGAAKFEIGKLYEYNFNNFDSAYAYYLKAKSTILPTEYLVPLLKKADKFKKYNDLKDNLNFNKTQLKYALNPEEFVSDSLAYLKMQDSVKQLNSEFQNISNATRGGSTQNLSNSRRGENTGALQASFQARALQILKIKAPVRPNIDADSIKDKIVFTEYELGNLFYTDFNILDSAYYYYTDILENYPGAGYKAKTLFVLGNLYLAKSDTAKADSVFNYVYDNYKNDRIVNTVASILNKPLINFEYDPAKDIYTQAESELNKQNYQSSVTHLSNIYNNYPKSMSAPKALYTEGWIFENVLDKPDSAAIVYDSLTSKYPASEYARSVSQKLKFYHSEKQRIKKEVEDSLAAIQKAKEHVIAKDTSKTIKVNLVSDKQKESNADKIIPPAVRGLNKDSLREKEQIPSPDSLWIERRKEILRNEISRRRDSLNASHKTIPEDSTKIK